MESLRQDIRFALRTLRKSPGFTFLAIACLALGIATNSTIYSAVYAFLIQPLPFKDPERLVSMYETHPQRGWTQVAPSFATMRDWQDQARGFESVGALGWRSLTLNDGEEAERIEGATITASLFPTLGVAPFKGRNIRPEEDRPGAERVVLLSYDLWKRRYESDENIIGKTVIVNAAPHVVVGVMPEKFRFPDNQDAWIAMGPLETSTNRGQRGILTYGRLSPGTSVEQARSELQSISRRLRDAYPRDFEGWSANVLPLREDFVDGEVELIVLTMMGAVTFVLLIACANVANLLLARATGRQREIAIRAAIGAGRGRILRQLLTESVILALAGGVLGFLLSFWGVELVYLGIPPGDMPYYMDFHIKPAVLWYTVLISIVTGVLFGLAPALAATRTNLQEALKEGGRTGSSGVRQRLRSGLVVVEIALSLVLLIGASLFVRSFLNLQTMSGGFDPAPIMTMRFYLPGEPYDSMTARTQRVEDVVRRVASIPGVEAAAVSNNIPLSGGGGGATIVIEGQAVTPGQEPRIFYAGVTPHWLKTFDVRLVSGRDFSDAEGYERSAVAIVDETMTKKFWPNGGALGARFRMTHDTATWFTVIGISRAMKVDDLDDTDPPEPMAFVPYPYQTTRANGLSIRVAGGDPAAITPAVRRAIRSSDPLMPVYQVMTMDVLRELGFWQYKLFGWMFSTFGGIALVLAAIGVYGVIAYSVEQRTQEIGVRMALGARESDVVALVVRQGLTLAAIGIAIGLVVAFWVTQVVQSMLVGVSARDPLSFGIFALFLTLVALAASYFPARKAMRVDPIIALRYE